MPKNLLVALVEVNLLRVAAKAVLAIREVAIHLSQCPQVLTHLVQRARNTCILFNIRRQVMVALILLVARPVKLASRPHKVGAITLLSTVVILSCTLVKLVVILVLLRQIRYKPLTVN